MEIKVKELLTACESVSAGLAAKEMLEQSTSLIFRGGRVFTYNDSIGISNESPFPKDFVGSVTAKEFISFLKKLKNVTLTYEIEESQIVIQSGKQKAGFVFEQEIKLPIIELDSIEDGVKIHDSFLSAMSKASSVCAADLSIPVFTCVHITNREVEASDRYRLYHQVCVIDGVPFDILIPKNSIAAIIKAEPTLLSFSDGWIHFTNDAGLVVSSRIYEEKFPDTGKFRKPGKEVLRLPLSLLESLEMAEIFTDTLVELTITKTMVKVRSQDAVGNWFESELNTKNTAIENLKFSFQAGVLHDVLKSTNTCTINGNLIVFIDEEAGWTYSAIIQ